MITANKTGNMKELIDENGYLIDLDGWTEDVARVLAAREGIRELSKEQLDILLALRAYYRKYAFFPILRAVCASAHQTRSCITDNFRDPVTAWKLAGLPDPGEEVRGFRSWEPLGY